MDLSSTERARCGVITYVSYLKYGGVADEVFRVQNTASDSMSVRDFAKQNFLRACFSRSLHTDH